MESSWTVTEVSVEFDYQAECQQDRKKIEIPCGKNKKVHVETAQKSWQESLQKYC